MAVTDLTGYTWVANNTLNYYLYDAEYEFDINFTSNSNSYSLMFLRQMTIGDPSETQLYYDTTQVVNNGYWSNAAYKTVLFTGGTDITNADLIAWVEGNGTLTPPTPVGYDVTFVTNGGTAVAPLEDVSELPDPLPTTTKAKTDMFVGWYYDTLMTQRAYAGDELTSNVTLYARFYASMDEFYTHVANAIRTKNATTGFIKHTDFADGILKL